MRGQLKEILMGINEEINRENMDLGGIYRIDFLDDLVRICQCSILEQSSLYLAVEGKKEFIPSSLENEEPDEELRREKMRKMAEKIRKVISVEKIQNYVNRYLAEKDELEASQLPLNNEEDFIKLIYVRLYGQRKNMGYVIETLEEREVNGYRFKDFRRKWNIWKECCKKKRIISAGFATVFWEPAFCAKETRIPKQIIILC